MVSETGTEDWGQEEDNSTKDDGNWATVNQTDDKVQTPQSQEDNANAQKGGEGETTVQSSTSPVSSQGTTASSRDAGDGGEHKETTIFSLSRGSDLVTRYTSKRGKSRGRGQRSGGPSRGIGGLSSGSSPPTASDKDKTKSSPPKPGSSGITVIEPLEKRLQKQQEDNMEKGKEEEKEGGQAEGAPAGAVPTAATANSVTKDRKRPGSGRSPSNKDGASTGSGGGGGGQAPTSKPKRYSSQRQKGL